MHKEKQNGFTLIEMGVVLFAIVVLMSVIVPNLIGFRDAATLEASVESIRNWTKVAQSTGMNMAQFEPCDPGDGCTFRKYIDGLDCPSQLGSGNYYYDNGACVYDLSTESDRLLLTGLPGLGDYTNRQNGNPIYLLHDAQTVQAFTCVDLAFVEGTSANYATIKAGSIYEAYCTDADAAALFHSIPALTANYAKAIARKMVMDGAGAGDDDDDGSVCGDGTCNGGETVDSCYVDCDGLCGDGLCNGPESIITCPADCSTLGGGTSLE
jgi:prepilin-type N-terminal cleavage/methylation domain-containing protein